MIRVGMIAGTALVWSPAPRSRRLLGHVPELVAYRGPYWGVGGGGVMNADGSGVVQTITTNSGDYVPVWRPR